MGRKAENAKPTLRTDQFHRALVMVVAALESLPIRRRCALRVPVVLRYGCVVVVMVESGLELLHIRRFVAEVSLFVWFV